MKIYRLAEDVPAGYILVEIIHDGKDGTAKTTIVDYGPGASCSKIGGFKGRDAGRDFVSEFEKTILETGEAVGEGHTNDHPDQQGVKIPSKTAPQAEAPYANTPQRRQKEDEPRVDLGI